MNKTERHQEILNLLISKERIEINELCEMFHIVPMTARRDLKELEEAAKVFVVCVKLASVEKLLEA